VNQSENRTDADIGTFIGAEKARASTAIASYLLVVEAIYTYTNEVLFTQWQVLLQGRLHVNDIAIAIVGVGVFGGDTKTAKEGKLCASLVAEVAQTQERIKKPDIFAGIGQHACLVIASRSYDKYLGVYLRPSWQPLGQTERADGSKPI